MDGMDNASPRYVYMTLEKVTQAIYRPDDNALLAYLIDDGISIEPD
jgi:DNA topoisomerase-2